MTNKIIYRSEDIIIKKMVEDIWKENEVINEIASGKHDDVFDEEDKKEVTQMIEQDNYDMRIQRIISGIERKEKENTERLVA